MEKVWTLKTISLQNYNLSHPNIQIWQYALLIIHMLSAMAATVANIKRKYPMHLSTWIVMVFQSETKILWNAVWSVIHASDHHARLIGEVHWEMVGINFPLFNLPNPFSHSISISSHTSSLSSFWISSNYLFYGLGLVRGYHSWWHWVFKNWKQSLCSI